MLIYRKSIFQFVSFFFNMEDKITKQYFSHHCPETTRLNNGSFGCVPLPVKNKAEEYRANWLSQPDDIYFNHLQQDQKQAKQVVGNLINAEPERISFVNNATTAGTIVAQKIMWDLMESKESNTKTYVLQFDICYPALRKSVEAFILRAGAELLEVKIPFPYSDSSELLDAIEQSLQSVPLGSVKIAYIDHISSVPAILFPLKETVALLRKYNVSEIFVDGAHSVGQVPLDMKDIDVEYYVSNLHKWMFAPVGCAFFYTAERVDNPSQKSTVHHAVPSFFYNQTLSEETKWAGTDDYAPRIAAPEGIRFSSLIGNIIESDNSIELLDQSYDELLNKFNLQGNDFSIHHGLTEYNRKRTIRLANQLAKSWGGSISTPEDSITSLANIQLPDVLPFSSIKDMTKANELRDKVRIEDKAEVFFFGNEKGCFIRLSCQIYNTEEDFNRLDKIIHQLMKTSE